MAEINSLIGKTLLQFLTPVKDFLEDQDVNEVMINGPDEIYVEQRGRLVLTDRRFASRDGLMAAVRNLGQFVGVRINHNQPFLDARLPDGSRVHVVMPPCASNGPYIAIRRFSDRLLSVDDLVANGSMPPQVAALLAAGVKAYKNMVVAGGTGSGKTTMLNLLSAFCDPRERVVTIEEANELQLRNPHVLTLECRAADDRGEGAVTIRDLLKSALRLRPDRIIVGEVRGAEALDMVQAMNTGHSGSMTTVHANSCRDALARLETLVLTAGLDMPLVAARALVASAIELVVHTSRFPDGSRRLTGVSAVNGLDDRGNFDLADVFRFRLDKKDPATGKVIGELVFTGNLPGFFRDLQFADASLREEMFVKDTGEPVDC